MTPASPLVIALRDDNFDTEVLRPSWTIPILIEFGSEWCPPCKALAPIVRRLAETYAGRLRVAKVDVNDAPAVARRLGIRGTPTVVVFHEGREIARQLGTTTRERMLSMCNLG